MPTVPRSERARFEDRDLDSFDLPSPDGAALSIEVRDCGLTACCVSLGRMALASGRIRPIIGPS